jgi:hypothetical protein
MSASDLTYRVFAKKRLNDPANQLGPAYYASAEMLNTRDLPLRLSFDALVSQTSTVDVVKVQPNVDEGDIIIITAPSGGIVYTGILNRINDKTLDLDPITAIFADQWKWRPLSSPATIEGKMKSLVDTDWIGSADPRVASLFSAFQCSIGTGTNGSFESQESDYVLAFDDFLRDCFDKFFVRTDITVPFAPGTPAINFSRSNADRLMLADNTPYVSIDVVSEVYETNKLVVYSTKKEADGVITPPTLRGTWYATKNGITQNSASPDRLPKVKTTIVFSDDDPISIVVAQNLRADMYNHEIEATVVVPNEHIDPLSLEIGQPFDIYKGVDWYDTILTGRTLEKAPGGLISSVKLKFGKARTRLTDKWKLRQ